MNATSNVSGPAHGGQLRQIAARYSISADQLLDFSANINPAGPPASVLAALHVALEDPATLTSYPDLDLSELKDALANHAQVGQENISVANGFVPLLEAALRSLKIERCLLPVPCFSEYRRTLENANVAVCRYLPAPMNYLRYEPDSIVEALLSSSCDAILLANPQNPSGALLEAGSMRQLIKAAAHHNITVLLDEAFIDYCPTQSLTAETNRWPNLIVFRSLTKFFAMPGLRIAYAIAQSASVTSLNHSLAPWPVSSIVSAAVSAALQDEYYSAESRTINGERRAWLERELARLKVFTYPSHANFLLLRFSSKVDVNLVWERMIVEEGVVLRSCENFEELAPGHLRIAVRSESENERLILGLERVVTSLLYGAASESIEN